MVASLLNKLANYTNITQGAVEHEEAESEDGIKRVTVNVSLQPNSADSHKHSLHIDSETHTDCAPDTLLHSHSFCWHFIGLRLFCQT